MSSRPAKARTPKSVQRVCILVVGMHRSGTSAFARVLSLLGCDLPKTLMQPNQSNEVGHWESDVIRLLNDRILTSAGTKWDDWLEVGPGWLQSPKAGEFREEALELLRQEFGSSRLFVLKDPRVCRILPFWLGVLEEAGVRPMVVSPVRNPLEVAGSLRGRNGFEAGLGHLLWLRHVLDAEFASRGTPRFFTSYDRLIGGWARVATDAQSVLGVSWPRMTDKVAGEIEGFLSDNHRHHQQPVEAVLDNPTLSDWLRSTFEILSRWTAAGENAQDLDELDRIRSAMNTAAPAFSRLLAAEQAKSVRAEKQLSAVKAAEQEKAARLEKDLSAERQRLGEAQQQIVRLKSELEAQSHFAEEGQLALTDTRHRLAQTESALAQRSHEAEQTALELAAMREDLRQAIAARIEAEKVSAGLKEHIGLLMADVKDRQAALLALQQARTSDAAESNSSMAAVAKQLNRMMAVLETSHHQLTMRLCEAEKVRASQAEKIEALRRQFEEKQGEARHERSEAERLMQVAVGGIGRAAGLLNGTGSPFHWRPFRLRRQVALLRKSGVFDAEWYLREYTDVAQAGIDPMRHYIEYGAKEGRAPNPALRKTNGHANGNRIDTPVAQPEDAPERGGEPR